MLGNSEIIKEIKRDLVSEENKDNDCISLYDVFLLIKNAKKDYDRAIYSYGKICNSITKFRMGFVSRLIIYDFDYDEEELMVGLLFNHDYGTTTLSKKDEKLYISKTQSLWINTIFNYLAPVLSELYDKLMGFSIYKNEEYCDLKAVNSNYQVRIGPYGVSILVESSANPLINDLKLSYSDLGYNNCDSNIFKEISKRIFVKISECPYWSQTLYEIRQKQLDNEKSVEDKQLYAEMKKYKKLELKQKIFPRVKK